MKEDKIIDLQEPRDGKAITNLDDLLKNSRKDSLRKENKRITMSHLIKLQP